jgi:hypothetical protein
LRAANEHLDRIRVTRLWQVAFQYLPGDLTHDNEDYWVR